MSIFKTLGKILSAPARGIGHALATSGIPLVKNVGSAAENVGNAFAGKGSFLGDLGQAGKAAAPVAALVPGVGPLAAGALGAGGELLQHGTKTKLGDLVKAGAVPAATAYLRGHASDILGKAKGLVGGGGPVGTTAAEEAAAAGGGGGGVIPGLVHSVGSYITKHPLDAARIGLAGLSTIQGAKSSAQGNQAIDAALGRFPPAGTRVDLSDVFADPTNPYRDVPRRQTSAQKAAAAALGA